MRKQMRGEGKRHSTSGECLFSINPCPVVIEAIRCPYSGSFWKNANQTGTGMSVR